MKNILSLSFLLCISTLSFSQTNSPNVVASGGDYFVGGTFTNSYTIGEMAMVETFTSGTFMLTQGFQQPYAFPLGVAATETSHEFSAFPNPTSGQVAFQYNLTSDSKISVAVFDALGQIVLNSSEEKTAGPQVDNLNLTKFSNGLYTVRYSIETQNGNSTFFVNRITLNK